MGGLASSSTSAAEDNYPSLWSGGVTWEDEDAGTGTQAYWQTVADPTTRTGFPEISVAIGGEPVTGTIRSASWQLGRSEWLSVLPPGAASFEVEGEVAFDVMDTVVVGVMSDTTDEHSSALWGGYVDSIRTTHETSGRIVTSVGCIDLIGRLGQSAVPEWTYGSLTSSVGSLIESVCADVGTPVVVVDNTTSASPTNVFEFEEGESVLGFLNRIEQTNNLSIFVRGDGGMVLVNRWYVEPEVAPTAAELTGASTPATWTTETTPTSVINDLSEDVVGVASSAALTSQETYGKRSYSIPDEADGTAWSLLSDSGVLLDPRSLASADFPITDLGHAALFLDPSDWVELDEETYQVLSVQHSVEPGHNWRVSITGDSTQVALLEASA
jgi:hypothetical protein